MPAGIHRRRFIAIGAAAAALPLLSRGASAQGTWPSRQIRMICSYPAGGQTDLLARAFGEYISKQVGQTVVVENKAGAGGSIGAAEVARAEPDGHTILCSISTTYVMNRVMMKTPGYDTDKDLTLVSVLPGAGLLLVASPKSGVRTLADFVDYARKSGKVNFGTYSPGSAPHMTINELNRQYGLNIEPIHYRGEAPMWTGMAEGTLDVAMGSFIGDLLAPKYPASFMALEQNPDWQLIQFMIAPTAVFNPFKYQDPQVDEYMKEIQYGDEATQASVAKELNTYIVEQAWFAPFYRVQGSVATDANTTVEMLPTNAYPAIYDFQPKQ